MFKKQLIYGLVLSVVLLTSCANKASNYKYVIVENAKVNKTILDSLKKEERVLLTTYLFVYANECTENSKTVKCDILKKLAINECATSHKNTLKKWFKNDVIMSLKLQNCPVLPAKFAVQNKIKKIIISKNSDTISITINVVGMNTSQEKNWNIEQTVHYLIKNNSFEKI